MKGTYIGSISDSKNTPIEKSKMLTLSKATANANRNTNDSIEIENILKISLFTTPPMLIC